MFAIFRVAMFLDEQVYIMFDFGPINLKPVWCIKFLYRVTDRLLDRNHHALPLSIYLSITKLTSLSSGCLIITWRRIFLYESLRPEFFLQQGILQRKKKHVKVQFWNFKLFKLQWRFYLVGNLCGRILVTSHNLLFGL